MKKKGPSTLLATLRATVLEGFSAAWRSLRLPVGQLKRFQRGMRSHISLPVLVWGFVLIITLFLWLWRAAQERVQIETLTQLEATSVNIELAMPPPELLARLQSPIPKVLLVAGTVMALLLALAVHLAQTAHSRAYQLETTNQKLQGEIAARLHAQEAAEQRALEQARSLEALRNQTRILQSILESMGLGAIAADENGKLILFNRAAQKIHGIGSTDTNPAEWSKNYNLFLPDMVTPYPPSELPLARAIRGIEVNEAEVFVVRGTRLPDNICHQADSTNGSSLPALEGIWVSAIARPLIDETGALRGGVVVMRDITHRKRAEEELQQSEERFRSLSASSPVGIFMTSVDGRCTYTNPRCQAICDFTFEESLGEGWSQSVHPEDRQRVFADWSTCTSEGQQYSDEFRFQTKEGIVRWVHVRSSPMFSDKGKLIGHVGTVEDITERKQGSLRLAETENRWRTIIDNEPECVKLVAADGTLLEINAAGLAMIEAPSAEAVIGQSVYSLIAPEHIEAFQALNESVCSGNTATLEFEIISLKGTRRWMETHAVPLPNPSDGTLVQLAIARDITVRKQAESERIRLLALEQTARAKAEESFQRFRFLSEIIPVQVWTAQPDGELDYVNQRVLDYFGRTSEEMLGKGWQHVLHPDDLPQCLERWSNSLTTGEPYEIEFRLLRAADKTYRWHIGRALPLHDDSGRIVCWFGTSTDIDDRQRTIEALRVNKERFRNLVETTSEWVWEVNEKGVYTYVSPKVRDLLGYEPEEVLGKTPFDLMPPEEAFRVANIFGPIAAKQQPFSFLENTNLHKDCHLVVLETSGVPVFDSDGTFRGYRGIDRDVTERKRTEEALRQSEELYRLLVNGVKDYAIFMLDTSGHVVSWNAGAERIKGYRAEEIIGKHFSCYYQPKDIQQGKPEHLLEIAATNGRVEDEGWRVRADGSRFWANVVITALRNEGGELLGFSKMTRDITERKRAEEALRESEQRYRSVIDSAAEGIVLLYADGRISASNASAERILGLSCEQMMGRSSLVPRWSAIHEDGSPFPGEIHPAMVTLRTGEPQSNVVMGVRKSGGMVTWISVNTRPLFHEGESTPYGVVFSFFDITERKQVEEVLRLSDEVLKQMPDAILLTDLEGNIQKWLGKSEQIFGYTAQEAIGKPINFLHRPEYKEVITAKIIKQIQETGTFFGEIPCVRKDGSFVPIETTAKVFYDKAGKPLFLVGLNRDITERKRTEEALQQANSQLKAWVSELEVRNLEITLLSEMSDVLQACLTVEEAYVAIAHLVQPMFPNVSGGVFAINASNNLVEAVAIWGDEIASMKLFSPNECWGLRRGRSHWVADSMGDSQGKRGRSPLCECEEPDTAALSILSATLSQQTSRPKSGLTCKHLHRHPDPAESLCVPMMAQGIALGLLYLSSPEAGHLTEAKRLLAVTVAEHIGLALANLALRETLQNQSIRDPLTGLFNRRYLEESLLRELHRAERSQHPLGIIMLDVDHFKNFNDTFGHDAGDRVLREMGLFLKKSVRQADIACRYGGEEFLLILPETSREETMQLAEQLREGVKYLNVPHRCAGDPQVGSVGSITISLGVACFSDHGLTAEAIVSAADAALYRAKREGRNKVSLASPLGGGDR